MCHEDFDVFFYMYAWVYIHINGNLHLGLLSECFTPGEFYCDPA